MSAETQGFDVQQMQANAERLADNPYPGRGIILGNSADATKSVLAYWVMGRSSNSRNRVLVQEDDIVKTEAFDPSAMEDPSLVIYNAMREVDVWNPTFNTALDGRLYVVSNGDQTDTVHRDAGWKRYDIDGQGATFRQALLSRKFEPDAPNYTPRITGMIVAETAGFAALYHYSLIKRNPTTGRPEHTFGEGDLKDIPAGAGICLHTYRGDGNPLPSFEGSPYAMPLEEDAEATAEALWEKLDSENRVALAVKTIDKQTGEVVVRIVNQLAA